MELAKLLETAEMAARDAGHILKTEAAALREVEFQDRRDVKLRADRESEERIRQMLEEAFPYPVYGEEKGGDESLCERDEPYWVVDPLHGTFH